MANANAKLIGRKNGSTIIFLELYNLARKLVQRRSLLGPNLFDPKLTQLTHLLSFASFFSHMCPRKNFFSLSPTWQTPTYLKLTFVSVLKSALWSALRSALWSFSIL